MFIMAIPRPPSRASRPARAIPWRPVADCLYHRRSAARAHDPSCDTAPRRAGTGERVMTGTAALSREQLKEAVCEAINRHGNEIIELGETILHHPETGFNEAKTAALVAERMAALGLSPQTGLALTGVKGRIRGRSPGPRLAVIGELDSLRTSDHP